MVAAQTPHVPLGVLLEHRHGAASDLVDVLDLPGGVVQEVHRRLLDQDVVVVSGAAHERGDRGDDVADLEPDALGEETLGGCLVGGPDHHVTELAWRNRTFADDAGCPPIRTVDAARPVVGRRRSRVLGDLRRDGDHGAEPGDRFLGD